MISRSQVITQPRTSPTLQSRQQQTKPTVTGSLIYGTLPLPPKIRVFLWKAIRGALPLGSRLEMRGITKNTGCVLYGTRESVNHLFLSCPFKANVWTMSPISPPPPTGVHLVSLFLWIVWTIWLTKNEGIFENKKFDEKETF